jgi:uncharacterized protein YbaR (Trm112 family)
MDRKEIKSLLDYLENNFQHLNSMHHEFIGSLKDHYNATGVLTNRQVECLYDIKEYIPTIVVDKTVYQSESDSYRAQYSSFDHLTPFNR